MSEKKKRAVRKPEQLSVVCKVPWCVCLAATDGAFCAAHRLSADIHPEAFEAEESLVYVRMVGQSPRPVIGEWCETCEGSGECMDCDGTGEHECEHARCYDRHDCHDCDGTGKCPDCDGKPSMGGGEIIRADGRFAPLLSSAYPGDKEAASNWLRAVYLPEWLPPPEAP